MSRHRRVKPASAAGHTCRLCNLVSHGAGGGGGGGKGRDSTFTCGKRQCKSPHPAQPASQPGQAACWPWRYGPTSMWPNPVQPPKYPVHPQSAGEDCQQCPGLGKWLRMKIRMLPPCLTVGRREDAHSPRVKVVRLESWEEYSV